MAFQGWAAPVLCVLLTSFALNAQADPVRVTNGSLIGDTFGARLSATGERGLTITGVGDKVGGIYRPAERCFNGPCFPNDLISIQARFTGNDFPGMVSVDGDTFRIGGFAADAGNAIVDFRGSLLLPEFAGQTLVSLTTPFSFSGSILFPQALSPEDSRRIALLGAGTATLQFEWAAQGFDPPEWRFLGARYEFEPVPEPGSLSLLGLGMSGLAAGRALKRKRLSV